MLISFLKGSSCTEHKFKDVIGDHKLEVMLQFGGSKCALNGDETYWKYNFSISKHGSTQFILAK